MKSFIFDDAETAWAEINRMFIRQDPELFGEGQGAVITDSVFTYGLSFLIEKAHFNPDFDFGKIMGYSIGKWTSLLNNYVDLDALDRLKLLVREFEKNKAVNRNYHLGFNFADAHGNGKGCLVSGMFSRMIYIEKPRLTIIMRASDVVTRLAWDLLLACRLGEYVYGHSDFTIEVFMRSAFANDISLMLYNGYEDIEKVISEIENEERRKRLKKVLKRVRKASSEGNDPKYQAYMRVYKIFNPEAYDKPPKSLFAKDCEIGNWDGIPLPEVCPSIMVRNQIKKVYLKFTQKYGLNLFAAADKSKKVINFSKEAQLAAANDDDLPFELDEEDVQEVEEVVEKPKKKKKK